MYQLLCVCACACVCVCVCNAWKVCVCLYTMLIVYMNTYFKRFKAKNCVFGKDICKKYFTDC